jgi:hypothetical protein
LRPFGAHRLRIAKKPVGAIPTDTAATKSDGETKAVVFFKALNGTPRMVCGSGLNSLILRRRYSMRFAV